MKKKKGKKDDAATPTGNDSVIDSRFGSAETLTKMREFVETEVSKLDYEDRVCFHHYSSRSSFHLPCLIFVTI
jgi:hypothetical protein